MFALGNVQILQGKISEAFQTHLQAYKLFKATVGDRHHRTADACYKLGWHFHRQRKYGNAM
jgi:TolA-binding protein